MVLHKLACGPKPGYHLLLYSWDAKKSFYVIKWEKSKDNTFIEYFKVRLALNALNNSFSSNNHIK